MTAGDWVGAATGSIALILAVRDTVKTHFQSKSIKQVFTSAYEAFIANNTAFNQLCESVRSVDAQVKTVDQRVIDSQREHGTIAAALNSVSAELITQRNDAVSAMLAPKKRAPRKNKDEGVA